MFSCCFTAGKEEDEAQSGGDGVQNISASLTKDIPIKEQAKAYVPSWQREEGAAPVTGRRKPSSASKRPSPTSDLKKGEVRPTDYLYFGDGTTRNYVSKPGSSKSQSQGSDDAVSSQSRPEGLPGKDQSGYQATGLDNNTQMGYANLTYGGSLQYDYSGIQSFGDGP